MEQLTADELAEEIVRRKEQLLRKRQLIQESEAQMKRLRMIEELKDLDQELESETYHPSSSSLSSSSSSSSSSNSATSATSVGSLPIAENAVAAVAVIVPPKPKNGMLAYWAVKDHTVPDVELVVKRVKDAQSNSESRQTEHHRARKIHVGSQKVIVQKSQGRPCTSATWNILKRKLSETDVTLITHDSSEKRIWCAACPCYIRDDNLAEHVLCAKHVKAGKRMIESNLHQASLETAIKDSKTLSLSLSSRTHLFRCELVRVLLTSALPVKKADDFRLFLEKWAKVESTDSSNLLRDYLPVIKVIILLNSSRKCFANGI